MLQQHYSTLLNSSAWPNCQKCSRNIRYLHIFSSTRQKQHPLAKFNRLKRANFHEISFAISKTFELVPCKAIERMSHKLCSLAVWTSRSAVTRLLHFSSRSNVWDRIICLTLWHSICLHLCITVYVTAGRRICNVIESLWDQRHLIAIYVMMMTVMMIMMRTTTTMMKKIIIID